MKPYNHYFKPVAGLQHIDVYRVLHLFGVTDQALGHAIKKLLVAGGRGAKDIRQDVQEAIDTLQRWQEMRREDERAGRVADMFDRLCGHREAMPADFGQKNMLDPSVLASVQAFAAHAPREVQGVDPAFTDDASRQERIEQSGELAEEVYLAVDASPAPYMPGEEEYGVHNTHCCRDHGCKYSDPRCPVAYGDAPGIPCEECAR